MTGSDEVPEEVASDEIPNLGAQPPRSNPGGWDVGRTVYSDAFPGDSTAKATFLAIWFYFDFRKKDYCWPSATTLGRRIGVSRWSVLRALARLEKAGLITCERADGRTTRYRLGPAWAGVVAAYQSGSRVQPVAGCNRSGHATGGVAGRHRTGSTVPHEEAKEEAQEVAHPIDVENDVPRRTAVTARTKPVTAGRSVKDAGAPATADLTPRDKAALGVALSFPTYGRGLPLEVTSQRLQELAEGYPTLRVVGVAWEFLRPGGIIDSNRKAASGVRRPTGREAFWKNVHTWLKREEEDAACGQRVPENFAKEKAIAEAGICPLCGGPNPEAWVPCRTCLVKKGVTDGELADEVPEGGQASDIEDRGPQLYEQAGPAIGTP